MLDSLIGQLDLTLMGGLSSLSLTTDISSSLMDSVCRMDRTVKSWLLISQYSSLGTVLLMVESIGEYRAANDPEECYYMNYINLPSLVIYLIGNFYLLLSK